jgi:hypothetical protein
MDRAVSGSLERRGYPGGYWRASNPVVSLRIYNEAMAVRGAVLCGRISAACYYASIKGVLQIWCSRIGSRLCQSRAQECQGLRDECPRTVHPACIRHVLFRIVCRMGSLQMCYPKSASQLLLHQEIRCKLPTVRGGSTISFLRYWILLGWGRRPAYGFILASMRASISAPISQVVSQMLVLISSVLTMTVAAA